jgi:hypothetical protein
VLHTWFYPCEFRIGRNGKFAQIEQDYVPTSTVVRLLRELKLVRAPDDPTTVATLPPGTRATITLTDDEAWCKVEVDGVVAGWFRVDKRRLVDGRSVVDVFEGLSFAD